MQKEQQSNFKIKKWFAIYTKAKNEKKVEKQLSELGYEAYLPLKKELRQWKDRMKKVEIPLFSSYVFVKVNNKEYQEIPKQIIGFVKFVTIGGQKIAVRDKEIETIKKMLEYSDENIVVSNEKFELYQKVEIKKGLLRGTKGKLISFKGKYKIAVRIETIGTGLIVEIDKNSVKKIT